MPDTGETAAGDRTAIGAATVPPIRDPTTRRFLLIGFALWLVATVAFGLGGLLLWAYTAVLVSGFVPGQA